jgi:DNA-binding protein H-NS
MRTSYAFFGLMISLLFISTPTFSQTVNFDQTWKEFLENDKISNMSELVKPNKIYDEPDYAKYLLMNTNTCFCQSEISNAENLMAEIQTIDAAVHQSIPGFVVKKEDLESKIKAYHSLDAIWKQFLQTKEVSLEELEAVTAAKTSCEKKTLAKYSYMTAYAHFCEGNVPKSKDVFENRTLRLTEKTTLRVKDVEGLAPEVAKMKSMFQDLDKLEVAWKSFIKTGVSPGFPTELPLFPCNPTPKMKELVLRGSVDVCNLAPVMLDKIKKLQAESSVVLNAEVEKKIKEMEAAIEQNEKSLSTLNEAWEAFIPNNKVTPPTKYGYQYCSKEPLIRAYIMDGFAFTCDLAEEMLQKIDSLQRIERTPLEEITMIKINELSAINEQYKSDGIKIEKLWNKFIAQGEKQLKNYQSADSYCDNIHQAKDWTMRGLAGTCEEAPQYLEQIESFQRTFEFQFTKDLECQVQNLRIKIWDCRYQALQKLAKVEVSPTDSYEAKLKELMKEYEMDERPEACSSNN